jgi:hypothetical protein
MPGEPPATFLDLLAGTRAMPRFFDATADARDWSVERPFFAVPTGAGGLRSYLEAAAQRDVDLYRRIDRLTGAKAVFIRSGVPGSVGSAACALWQELAPYVGERRAFSVWPFEGHLEALLRSTSVVVGEIYPRAAYATALLDVPPASRAPLVVAKTDAKVRAAALAVLRATRWVASLDVTLEHLSEAEANEDDFDACLTAAALLRCVLDGSSLCPADLDLPGSEGGILGTGSVNLHLPARQFTGPDTPVKAGRGNHTDALERPGPVRREIDSRDGRSGERTYRCPIEGCQKFFRGSRGGWDAHVASLPSHPAWHPELKDAEERKRRFREEFPGFFS